MSDKDITEHLTAEERGLLEAQREATPLPWRAMPNRDVLARARRTGDQLTDEEGRPLALVAITGAFGDGQGEDADDEDAANAAYIVAAANAVPGLLDTIARLRGEVAHAHQVAVEIPDLNERLGRAEAERDELTTIAAAQERALKGDGDGSTVLESVLWDTQSERDALREAIRSFHEQHHGLDGGPFSRPVPHSLTGCSDPRCRALSASEGAG